MSNGPIWSRDPPVFTATEHLRPGTITVDEAPLGVRPMLIQKPSFMNGRILNTRVKCSSLLWIWFLQNIKKHRWNVDVFPWMPGKSDSPFGAKVVVCYSEV